MRPALLGLNPTAFNTHGIGVLNKTISCFVTEELNGEYSMTMEIAFDDPNFKNIEIGSVIAVQPNKYDPRQGFVVEHIGKPIDGICEIYATHIAQYRAKLIPVMPFTAPSLTGAIASMKTYSQEINPFKMTSDKTSSVAMKVTVPHTYRELMGGVQGSLLDTYGGEFHYDNYDIQFMKRRGRAETDIRVLYGKNMTDFNLEEDFSWTDSITGVLPFWSMEGSDTVIGSIQYSPYRDLFPYRKTVVHDCTDAFQDKPTVAQLNAYGAAYVANKGIAAVNMQVSFDHLQFSRDRNMQIGDMVEVINSMYKVSYNRRIVGYTFNVLLEEYEAVVIGDLKASISDAVNESIGNAVSDLTIVAENVNYSNANSGLSAKNAQTALDELADEKSDKDETISNITRSGTTFTATRADGTTFTFTQQGYTPSNATPTDVEHGGTASAGTAVTYARGDHKHAISVGNGNYNGSVYVGGQDLYVGGWDTKANTADVVPKTGGRFSGEVYFAQGTEVINDNISGQSGTTGWVEICRITVTNTYIDAPIYIMLSRRGDLQPSEVCIRYANLNGTDPTLQSLTVNGPLPSTHVAMVKENTSIWGVYVYKTGYNVINPLALHIPYYIKNKVSLAWLLTGTSVTSLSNATYATKQVLTQVQGSVRINHGTTHTIAFDSYNTTALIYVALSDSLGALYVYSYGYIAPIKTATGITVTKSSDYLTITVKNTNTSQDGILGVLQSGDRQITIS